MNGIRLERHSQSDENDENNKIAPRTVDAIAMPICSHLQPNVLIWFSIFWVLGRRYLFYYVSESVAHQHFHLKVYYHRASLHLSTSLLINSSWKWGTEDPSCLLIISLWPVSHSSCLRPSWSDLSSHFQACQGHGGSSFVSKRIFMSERMDDLTAFSHVCGLTCYIDLCHRGANTFLARSGKQPLHICCFYIWPRSDPAGKTCCCWRNPSHNRRGRTRSTMPVQA